jgi:hypothetical protein
MSETDGEKLPELRVKAANGEWVLMNGILEYLGPADKEQFLAWVREAKATGDPNQNPRPHPQDALLERFTPAGRAAYLSYKDLAMNGGLPAVQAMYKRETGSDDLAGLRAWLEKRRGDLQL